MTQGPDWADPPKPGAGKRGVWEEVLKPLTQHPGRWARIYIADTPELAQSTVSNLNRRLVVIPKPQAKWEFVGRGREVFARFYPGTRTPATPGRKARGGKAVRGTKRGR